MKTALKNIKRIENFDYRLLVDTAILAGEIMLKNGSETNRVEKAMDKLLRTTQMKHIEAVVMTTSIIVTLSDPSLEHMTAVSRIHDREINLNKVDLANNLVNQYCEGKINLEELFHALKNVKKTTQYSNLLKAIGTIISLPAFSIILGGTFLDALVVFICAIVIVVFNKLLSFFKTNDFVKHTLITLIASFVASSLSKMLNTNLQVVIAGMIMPYIPGVAITNAARDTFNADYMSGAARILDALVQAFSVALGVYLGLYISNLIH